MLINSVLQSYEVRPTYRQSQRPTYWYTTMLCWVVGIYMIFVDWGQNFLGWENDSWLDGAVAFFYSRFGLKNHTILRANERRTTKMLRLLTSFLDWQRAPKIWEANQICYKRMLQRRPTTHHFLPSFDTTSISVNTTLPPFYRFLCVSLTVSHIALNQLAA